MLSVLLLVAALVRGAQAQTGEGVVVVSPPAPALWRATRGGGELWMLPVPSALPRGMAWNRLRLEGLLRGARALITPAGYVLERTGRSPRPAGASLAARLPASVQTRFEAAIAGLGESPARFAGLAPLDAAYRLRDDGWRAADLDADQPDAEVRALARRAGVPVRPVATYRVRIDAGAPALSDRQAAGCLDAAVDDVAWAREHAAQSARAWSLGDVRAWLAQARPPGVARCLDAAPAFAALRARNLDDVTAAAERALAGGGRSVLLTDPTLLLRTGGLLDRLRADGVMVEAPAADR